MEVSELQEKSGSLLLGCKAKKNFREERVTTSKATFFSLVSILNLVSHRCFSLTVRRAPQPVIYEVPWVQEARQKELWDEISCTIRKNGFLG